VHIALCGPVTLSLLQPHLDSRLHTSGYPFPGTSLLALKYRELGHNVTVITTAPDIVEPVVVRGDGLSVAVVPSRVRSRSRAFDFFKEERRQISAQLREARPDVCHAHWTYEFALGVQSTGLPNLITVHDWAPAVVRQNRHPYWMFRAAMQVRTLSRSGPLSAPSKYIASRVERWYGKECSVIPNGIDLSAYSDRIGRQSHSSDDRHLRVNMLNVGWSTRKNVMSALRAWPKVLAAHPAARLHLGGPGYERGGQADTWARREGLSSGVSFDGPVDPIDVPGWIAASDIFLHTSREESFGIVLIEAMAAGVPVIAGVDSGAVAEITDGSALLIDVDSPHQIARAVLGLHQDTQSSEQLSLGGKEVASRFDLDAIARRFETMLMGLA
jgi:glycosyltransferase involved in cell wall biosynthesis